MAKIDDGGPAFPSHGSMGEVTHQGMSLRDWFAGQALAGLYANRELQMAILNEKRHPLGGVIVSFEPHMAEAAYEAADAMLAMLWE